MEYVNNKKLIISIAIIVAVLICAGVVYCLYSHFQKQSKKEQPSESLKHSRYAMPMEEFKQKLASSSLETDSLYAQNTEEINEEIESAITVSEKEKGRYSQSVEEFNKTLIESFK
ncbi:MAG: hypothetical protein U9P63_00725 [Patescibacteria group bacterium]|nr:hypothetical protein [Patescibacteria group bacterium]